MHYGGRPPSIQLGADNAIQDGRVRFGVRDSGPGLTEADRTRLFVPFARLHGAEAKGHGLGLSIVQRMVDRLGGQVGVESRPGEGCLFYFTLPAAPAGPEPKRVEDAPNHS